MAVGYLGQSLYFGKGQVVTDHENDCRFGRGGELGNL